MRSVLEWLAGANTPWEHAMNGVLAVMIAVVGLLAPTAALLCRPLRTGEGKRFWLWGAVYEAAVHAAAYMWSMENSGVCLLAAALAVGQWFVLRHRTDQPRRLGIALGLEAVLTVILYILLHGIVTVIIPMMLYT